MSNRMGFECQIGFHPKYRHPTLEEAWLVAFRRFVETGKIHSPYKCNKKKKYRAEWFIHPNKNPWAWAPTMVKRSRLRRAYYKKNSRPCNGYHLTTLPPQFCLPPGRMMDNE